MSPWAAIFLGVSALCGVFGFAVPSGTLAAPAKLLCMIFLVLGAIAFTASMIRRHTGFDLMATRTPPHLRRELRGAMRSRDQDRTCGRRF